MVKPSSRCLALALLLVSESWADDRLGSYSSSIPIIRGVAANVVAANIGEPEQQLQLALTTGSDYLAVVNASCTSCMKDAAGFNANSTQSVGRSETLVREFEYPPGRPRANGSFVTTNRAVGEVTDRGSVLVINKIDIEVGVRGERRQTTMTPGTDGFFGLGISSTDKERSFLYAATGGRFTLGIDTQNSDGLRTVGRLDWGGVNQNHTEDSFEWIKTNTSWTFGFESIGIRGGSIVGDHFQAAVDPGLNAIYTPFSVASDFYAQEAEAKLVKNEERTRWKVPCDKKLKFELKLDDGRGFGIGPELLRIREGETCYGAVYAWSNHSTPDKDGKIRLGTPFLDEWYTALSYSGGDAQVGFAKHKTRGEPGPDGRLIGGLVGSLVPLMLIFLVVVYARNTYAIPPWLDRYYRDMYDWEHAARAQAAMRAGMPAQVAPMPFGARVLHGILGPPRDFNYMEPMMMRGVTPAPFVWPQMQPGMPPMAPGMTGLPPQLHPAMTGMPHPMQPGMPGPLHPAMTGLPPPMQQGMPMHPAMTGAPPPLHPAMTGMPPPMQPAPLHPAMTGMPAPVPPMQPMQPMMTGVQVHPSMQPGFVPPPGLPPQFTGRPRTAAPPSFPPTQPMPPPMPQPQPVPQPMPQPIPAQYAPEFGGMPPGHRGNRSWSGTQGGVSEQAREQARQEVIDIMRPYSRR